MITKSIFLITAIKLTLERKSASLFDQFSGKSLLSMNTDKWPIVAQAPSLAYIQALCT